MNYLPILGPEMELSCFSNIAFLLKLGIVSEEKGEERVKIDWNKQPETLQSLELSYYSTYH